MRTEVCSEHGRLVSDIEWLKNTSTRVERKVDKLDEKLDSVHERITKIAARNDTLKNIPLSASPPSWQRWIGPFLLALAALSVSVGSTYMSCGTEDVKVEAHK